MRRRTAFTITELLVVMALIVFIMYILAEAFSAGSTAFRNLKDLSPMGRIGTESEVSAAIVFLLSEAAGFISGATLRVDGAVPMTRPSRPLPKHKQPAPAFDGFPLAETPKVLRD